MFEICQKKGVETNVVFRVFQQNGGVTSKGTGIYCNIIYSKIKTKSYITHLQIIHTHVAYRNIAFMDSNITQSDWKGFFRWNIGFWQRNKKKNNKIIINTKMWVTKRIERIIIINIFIEWTENGDTKKICNHFKIVEFRIWIFWKVYSIVCNDRCSLLICICERTFACQRKSLEWEEKEQRARFSISVNA